MDGVQSSAVQWVDLLRPKELLMPLKINLSSRSLQKKFIEKYDLHGYIWLPTELRKQGI